MTTLRLLAVAAALLGGATLHAASRLTNVSVRSTTGSGADTLIVGFTISGSGGKSVLVRGVGPTLASFNVGGAATDSELRLFNAASATPIAENDNWGGAPSIATTGAAVGAFALPTGSLDAAVLATLTPGSYSAHVSAKSSTGIALVEAYDADPPTSAAQLTNVSARSVAGTDAAVLTVGFAISGDTPKTVLIRAVGPTLAGFGVSGTVANPQLRLFSGRGTTLGTNDDWLAAAGWAAAAASVGAFALGTNSRDAVLLVRLNPGSYTAQASGVNNTTGVALIEVYDVANPPATSVVLQPVETLVPPFPVAPTPGVSVAPRVLLQARPAYPFEMRRAGITGEAVIEFVVDVDGRVINAYALRATDVSFAEAALAAVRQWTFEPGRNSAGAAVQTRLQVPIIFTLNEV